ncbi:hypothetical protein OEZ86_002940 [Tetradesmus obliquus]|nr:hypothetical protein OEZ86_002940 [Tetradesmus obliquus]
MRTAACVLLLLAIAGGAHAALTRRHLQQTMAGREARATDAATLTAVTIGRAVSGSSPRGGPSGKPTKGPAAGDGEKPPVKINSVGSTGQGSPTRQPTFNKAGPVVSTKAATTIGVKTTGHVSHPDDNAPVVGNKGGNKAAGK